MVVASPVLGAVETASTERCPVADPQSAHDCQATGEMLPDGSYLSVLASPKITGKARDQLIEAAKASERLDPDQARYVGVIEYDVPDRDGDGNGELIALITTTEWGGDRLNPPYQQVMVVERQVAQAMLGRVAHPRGLRVCPPCRIGLGSCACVMGGHLRARVMEGRLLVGQVAVAGARPGKAGWSFADPVFVLCNGRSGSTLLRFLLDAHPDLACRPWRTGAIPAGESMRRTGPAA